MGLEATHPDYDKKVDDWITLRDLSEGEKAVKLKRERYLPATPSMILDGFGKGKSQIGEQNYCSYLTRAQLPDYVNEGVEILVGMLNHKAPTIELPKVMEPMLKACTLTGESLEDLLRQIHSEVLTTGRVGLLADLPATDNANSVAPVTEDSKTLLPYIATYVAETIRNWDMGSNKQGMTSLNVVVLDESGYERNTDFMWTAYKQYRVLQLGTLVENEGEATSAKYMQGAFSNKGGASLQYDLAAMKEPMWKGKVLEEIPFVFINTKDLVATPDKAPLLGLAQLVLAIYRGEADYRQGLFMTGQDTLVVIGGTSHPEALPGEDNAVRVGAGARLDVAIDGDAKYIGVNSQGLTEQRTSLENDHKRAATKSGQLLASGKANSQESGEALKTRLAAQTASLTQIALTTAKGLETLLKTIAVWINADPEEVKVTPNMEFGEIPLTATDIKGLMEARLTGAPLSKKSIHALMVEKRLTNMTYEDEMEKIQEEDADMPRVAAGAGTLTAEEQLAQQEAQNELAAQKKADAENGSNKKKTAVK